MAYVIGGRTMFRVDTGEELTARLGGFPDSLDLGSYFELFEARIGPLGADEEDASFPEERHPVIGRLDYDNLWVPGSIFIVTLEVHPAWRRRGVARFLIEWLQRRFPGHPLLADRVRDSTPDGRAFVKATNTSRGGPLITRLAPGDTSGVTGYRPRSDDAWPPLAPRHLPRD